MFKNIFNRKAEQKLSEIIHPDREEPQLLIDSKHIQNDLSTVFADVLKQFDLKGANQSEIENLRNKLNSFKVDNMEIYDKIEKLKKFGFTQTPSAKKTLRELEKKEHSIRVKIDEINKQIKKANEINELVQEYSLKYPTFKFVDTSTMIKIMKKYDLVMGESFMYVKEIPMRALNIIEGFSKEILDSNETYQLTQSEFNGYRYTHYTYKISKVSKPTPPPTLTGSSYEEYEEYHKAMRRHAMLDVSNVMSGEREEIIAKYSISKLKMVAPLSHFEIPMVEHRDRDDKPIRTAVARLNETTRKFELSTLKINEVAEANKKEVLDPIACLEVKGGYIILDAWDEEADIPEIKNVNLN